MRRVQVGLLAVSLITASLPMARVSAQGAPPKMTVTSAAFKEGGSIPDEYSMYGKNVSPAIQWSGAPASARQFAVICHDPDAPMPGGFTHWVIYKIPATSKGLPEGIPAGTNVTAAGAAGATQGPNGFAAFARKGGPPDEPGYNGPRPPAGPAHHYHFTVYALDGTVDLPPGLDRNALLKAMEGHIVAQGEIVGLYERKQ
jgi:Raf kinase inhibitor-like YbhB/YbcL family protein